MNFNFVASFTGTIRKFTSPDWSKKLLAFFFVFWLVYHLGFYAGTSKLWLECKRTCMLRPSVRVTLSESWEEIMTDGEVERLTFWAWHNVFMKLEEEIWLMFLTNRRSWKQKGVFSCWVWINTMHQHTWLVCIWDSSVLPKIATSGVPFSSWQFGKFKVTYWKIAGNFYVSQYKRIFKN